MPVDDSDWDTPRAREEAAWARRELLATRIRNGSWKLLAAVAAVQVFQSVVSAFS